MLRVTRLEPPTPDGVPSLPVQRLKMVRTFLGRPVHSVSAYRVGGLLIDSGPPSTASDLVELLRSDPPERVLLTHHHEDHSGGAGPISRELGVPISAPAGAVPILAEGLRMPLYRRLVWGRRPETFRAEPLPEVLETEHLEPEHMKLRVVPTPGHAFTHVCLFDPGRRWLFSGDLFVHERVKLLRRIEDVGRHLASLRRALALEPERMFCAHAGPVEDARGALARKIRFWEELGERARDLRGRGWPVSRITRELLGRESLLTFSSFGDFSKRNLIRDLLERVG